MRCRVRDVAWIVLLVLGLAAPLAAQGSITGSVQGTVKDQDGGVLPGAAVTISSDVLITGKYVAATDERGIYRFPSLPPGQYAIEAELPGFQKVRQEGLRVILGQALGVDIVLPVAKVAEAITVSAEAPLVSVVANSVTTSFDSDFLNKQPLPRNYYNVIRSAPGVNFDYWQSSGSAMLAYGGTEERQNAFTLDGVNVADAGAGQHWILPAIQWFQEIQIAGLGANAEYGGYTGGIINGVTKSGGNETHGEVEFIYQPTSWTADNDPENDNDEFKFSDLAVTLGGPVMRDELWYFASAEYWNQVTTPVGALATSDRKIPRFLGKLTWQLNNESRLMFMSEYESVTNERRGVDAFTLPEASSKQEAPGVAFAVHWESLVNANNFFNVKATGYDGRDDYLPYNGTNTPGRVDYWNTEIYTVNAPDTQLGYRRVLTLDGTWSLYKDGLFATDDSHTFKFGALIEQGKSSDVYRYNGGFLYGDDSSACASWEAYLADPTCGVTSDAYIETGYGEYNQHPKFSGLHFFAQDSMRLDKVTVNVGLRYGSYKGGWQEGHGNSTVYDVNFVDPRIGLVWDVFGNARTAVKVHWGRYHEKMFTYLFDREISGNGVIPDQDCYWDEDTQTYDICDPAVVHMATMGKVNHPYVDESLLTLEQQFGKDMMVGVDLISRKFRDIMAMINVNDDYEEYQTTTPNPDFGTTFPIYDLLSAPVFVLTTDAGGYRDYKAAILRFEKRYSDGWQMRTSLVYTDLKGNVYKNNSYEYEWEDRNGFINDAGKMEKYSKWEYKLSGSYDLPFGFQASGQYTFLSGWYWTPYVRIRGLDYNASTGNYIWATERGSQQYPDRSLLDLRLAWSTKIGGAYNFTASLECFNVFNSDTVLEVSGRWGDYRISSGAWSPGGAYGSPTQIESPRQIRAGIRFEF